MKGNLHNLHRRIFQNIYRLLDVQLSVLLKKLVDQGYAKVVGEEMTHQQGRPRTIYELNFATY
ncbi:hypothetical protein OL548_07555 [Lysinibacillus sp. MHQ-1]|nr:hypothetical protein OL548_07555 [Lysinibacillus sp. MHQ-1]